MASVKRAVVTLPVTNPAASAFSRIVVRSWSLPAVVEILPLLVFAPVDHAVPVAAESGT